MRKISFIVDNQTLNGTIFYPEQLKEKNPAILFIHGWRSDEEGYAPRAEALTKQGFICLTFDMRSHGKSEGDVNKLTRQNYLDDCLAAFDFLTSQNEVDKNQVGVVGSSFGGYLGVIVTSKRNIRWLMQRVPANYPDHGFSDMPHNSHPENLDTHAWRSQKLEYNETVSLRAMHDFLGDVLIVESGDDTIVPRQTVRNYADAVADKSKLQYIVMENAGHALQTEFQKKEFMRILTEWFGKMIK